MYTILSIDLVQTIMKNPIKEIVNNPFRKLRAHSSKIYEQYNELFQSIRRLASLKPEKSKENGKG